MRDRKFLQAAVALIVAATIGFPVPAEDPSPAQTGSPLIRDVLRMLEEDVDSSVIVDWLARQDAVPGALSADDLIGLNRAGASRELIHALLEKSSGGATAAPPSKPGSPERDSGDPWLEVALGYSPFEDTEYDGGDQPWELFVYLDGELLGRAVGDSGMFSGDPLEFKRRVTEGRHTVRFTRERHTRAGRKSTGRWTHETQVAPEIIEIDIEPGFRWTLQLAWSESRFAFGNKGPLTWDLLRDEERVAGEHRTGTLPEEWPELCEDLEASVPPGEQPSRRIRRKLDECVRWPSLWEEIEAFPSRPEVLEFLARFDYEPVPASFRP